MLLAPDVQAPPATAAAVTLPQIPDQIQAAEGEVCPNPRSPRFVAHPAGPVAHVRTVPRTSPIGAQKAARVPAVNAVPLPAQAPYALSGRSTRPSAQATPAQPTAHLHVAAKEHETATPPFTVFSCDALAAVAPLDPLFGPVHGGRDSLPHALRTH